jgi:2-aminoadipate transaminase
MRLGYIIANKDIIKMLETAKQASDLHSNIFGQYLISDYLYNNDLDKHIEKIKKLYKSQAGAMVSAMEEFFPSNVKFTRPQGGMFTWVTLEEGKDVMKLFDKAIANNVAFVPGHPFYVNPKNVNTLRLNYTNADSETIRTGIKRLADALCEI